MRTILPLAPVALVVLALHTSAAQAANPPGTGDINGDGVADILMGDDGTTPGRPGAGAVRVVFGAKGAKRSLRLSRGFRIVGAAAHDGLARDGDYMRGIAGDVNGDGLDDVIVGGSASPQGRKRAGAAYVVFGKRDTRDVDLAALGDAGLEIQGPTAGGALNSVAGVGDFDGDGLDDVAVGAAAIDGPGTEGAGAAFVVAGRRAGGVVDLAVPDAAYLTVYGAAKGDQRACDIVEATSEDEDEDGPPHCDDGAGWSVAGPGDVNGDGFPDLVLDAGRPSVVFGGAGGTISLGALGDRGYRIRNVSYTSHEVRAAGDVNGDGLADFTVSDSDNPYVSTLAEVVFGARTAATLDYTRPGARALQLFGDDIFAVAGAGDFDGDRRADLVTAGTAGNAGVAYVAFGARAKGPMRLGKPGWRGVRIVSRHADGVDTPELEPVGDVNGDGRTDALYFDTKPLVLLGAPGAVRLDSKRLGARVLTLR